MSLPVRGLNKPGHTAILHLDHVPAKTLSRPCFLLALLTSGQHGGILEAGHGQARCVGAVTGRVRSVG